MLESFRGDYRLLPFFRGETVENVIYLPSSIVFVIVVSLLRKADVGISFENEK